jgi:putative glutamine amidotransferase
MLKRVLVPYRHAYKLPPYLDAIRGSGAEPVAASVDEPIEMNGIDGVLLVGGTDVNPARYQAAAWPETEQPDNERDLAESVVIDAVIEQNLPLLAICRGLQILNVHHGGSLVQHLSTFKRHDIESANKGDEAHQIFISPDSILGEIAQTNCWRVNSRHHQAVQNLGAGLRITARDSEDGTIEALEQPDRRFVLAVQWHPEDQLSLFPEQKSLFSRFVNEL